MHYNIIVKLLKLNIINNYLTIMISFYFNLLTFNLLWYWGTSMLCLFLKSLISISVLVYSIFSQFYPSKTSLIQLINSYQKYY